MTAVQHVKIILVKLKTPHLSYTAERVANAEKVVHLRRSKKYYNKLQSERESEALTNRKVLAIAFDYMENVLVLMISVQGTFYLRQLTVNIFCINDITKNTAQVYIYHEGQARKCPDEVCSFIHDYLTQVSGKIEEVHVHSDNCGGKNENHSSNRLFLALNDTGKFKKIKHYYPVRGHSFLPCDRHFAIIKRSLRKHDRLNTVHQVTEIIISSSQSGKFTVKQVDAIDIFDFMNWWQALKILRFCGNQGE